MIRASLIALALFSTPCLAQSLYLTAGEENLGNDSSPSIALEDVSLMYIEEPEAKQYRAHDIVTIIIDEVSNQTSSQTLETEKESETSASINTLVDVLQLLELRLKDQAISDLDLVDVSAEREFKGEGDYDRSDRFSARIAAEVLEVKPNGTLVLQATKRITKDDEEQVLVLAGVARSEDITAQNTILSSQLANLSLAVENEGEVKNAAKKGFLTKFFDTLFAF
jgi:flagellar L-ring protein precursor FlgH